jgi:acetyl esterase/lipase
MKSYAITGCCAAVSDVFAMYPVRRSSKSDPARSFGEAAMKTRFRTPIAFLLTIAALHLADATSAAAEDSFTYKQTTVVYKTVGKLDIKAEVWRPDDDKVRPVVVWIHGGALIMGHREAISGQVRKYALERGHALISLDYRLAPETKIDGIHDDIADAFRWIRGDGAKRFHLDPNRVAVTGGSAGGYLTFVTGYLVKPRPTALVAFWGYGDLVGEWAAGPSPHPRHTRIAVTRAEALQQAGGPPVSDARDRTGDGVKFYLYGRQTGLWPQHISGLNAKTEPDRFTPFMPVRNVAPDYPPTLMIHGTIDTDVPYEQSVLMAAEFKKHGVKHELISIPNGEHGLAGGDPKLIEKAYESAAAFLDDQLK